MLSQTVLSGETLNRDDRLHVRSTRRCAAVNDIREDAAEIINKVFELGLCLQHTRPAAAPRALAVLAALPLVVAAIAVEKRHDASSDWLSRAVSIRVFSVIG